jgi:hypothetical protein
MLVCSIHAVPVRTLVLINQWVARLVYGDDVSEAMRGKTRVFFMFVAFQDGHNSSCTARDCACFDRMNLAKIEHWMADRCPVRLVDLPLDEVA